MFKKLEKKISCFFKRPNSRDQVSSNNLNQFDQINSNNLNQFDRSSRSFQLVLDKTYLIHCL